MSKHLNAAAVKAELMGEPLVQPHGPVIAIDMRADNTNAAVRKHHHMLTPGMNGPSGPQ
jgi:hypothetical protein